MDERIQQNYDAENYKITTIQKVIDFLKSKEYDPEEHTFEFEITQKIEPADIQLLLQLPYEVALTERNNIVVLTTGGKTNIGAENDFLNRRDNSKLSLHTHKNTSNQQSINTPSFADIHCTEFAKPSTPLLLAYKEGIMLYSKPKPITDPENGKITDDVKDIMLIYCESHGIDLFGYGLNPSLTQWDEIPRDKKISIQRQFAQDTGMIIKEALWEDKEGVEEIMKYVNLGK
jgi:hypothetical protein